jgi:cell division control protein 6
MESVWRSEMPLLQEFTPEKPILRDAEISEMVESLKPALDGRRARNILIYGNPGTGKTTVSKYVAKKFCEHSMAIPVYINCWQSRTENALIARIVKALQLPIITIGVKSEDVLDEMFKELKENRRMLLLIFDEADQLISRRQEEILYEFSRSGELRGVEVELVMITNKKEVFTMLDDRIKSTLSPSEIEFKPYTPVQLKEILAERAKLAFRNGACKEDVIAVCAARGAKNGGDCRKAIECLWLAGKEAERKGYSSITLDCIVGEEESVKEKKEITSNLSEGEKKILGLISASEWTKTKKIYEQVNDYTERNVRYLIEKLKKCSLIEYRRVKEGKSYSIEIRKKTFKF